MGRKAAIAVTSMVAVLSGAIAAPAWAYSEKATVDRVSDGDTFHIVGNAAPVRIIGIDAPEHDTCGYGAAKNKLRELAGSKTTVKLSARNKGSYAMGNGFRRPLRYVYSYRANTDVSAMLLTRGLALFNNTDGEPDRELEYSALAQQATAAKRGLFAPNYCGPAPSANLQLYANYNADLNDKDNPAGKWVRVVNRGDTPVNLQGWRLRPSNRRYFTFPNVTLQPQQSAVVHNGSGASYTQSGDYHYYWGVRMDIPDPTTSTFKTGSIFMQDPKQNVRFATYWPCVVACPTTAVLGKLSITAEPKEEYVDVTNVSSETVDASFLVVENGASVFEIPQGNKLAPGASLRIWAQPHGSDYTFGREVNMMPKSWGEVLLRGNDGIVVQRYTW